MGLKHESTSDPSLAMEHAAGTPIYIIQHAVHKQVGAISHAIRRLWCFHHRMATNGYKSLCEVHERILHLPVRADQSRFLGPNDDPDLTLEAYTAGTQMLLNVVLTMQHFCQEIESYMQVKLKQTTLQGRVKEAFQLAGLTFETTSAGYSALMEIDRRRDAVEHPKQANVFSSHPNDWDQVPLNWLLTERAIVAFIQWTEWFDVAVKEWENHDVRKPRTVTVTAQRGVKSLRQPKKPPKK